MAEGHGAVVGIALLNQHMAVEPAHFRDGEDTDAAEGPGLDGQHLALSDVAAKHTVGIALEPVEGDVRGGDVRLQGTTGEVRRTAVFQQTVLDQLIFHLRRSDVFPGGLDARMQEARHIFVSYIMLKKCFPPGAFFVDFISCFAWLPHSTAEVLSSGKNQ